MGGTHQSSGMGMAPNQAPRIVPSVPLSYRAVISTFFLQLNSPLASLNTFPPNPPHIHPPFPNTPRRPPPHQKDTNKTHPQTPSKASIPPPISLHIRPSTPWT